MPQCGVLPCVAGTCPALLARSYLSQSRERRGACLQCSESSRCRVFRPGAVSMAQAASGLAAQRGPPTSCGVASQPVVECQFSRKNGAWRGAHGGAITGDVPGTFAGWCANVAHSGVAPSAHEGAQHPSHRSHPPATSARVRSTSSWVRAVSPNPMRRTRWSSAAKPGTLLLLPSISQHDTTCLSHDRNLDSTCPAHPPRLPLQKASTYSWE